MKAHKLNPEDRIQFDYWSNESQTFIKCGTFKPESTQFLPLDDLQLLKKHYRLVLRFAN